METSLPVRHTESVSRRILGRIATLSVIAVLTVLVAAGVGLWGTLQGVQRRLDETGGEAARAFDVFLGNIQNDLHSTSDALSAGADATAMLRRILDRQADIFELTLVDLNGTVLARERRLGGSGQPIVAQPWLPVVEGGGTYVGPVDYREYGVPAVEVAVSLTTDREMDAVLVADVNMTRMWEVIASLRAGETGYVYVTDATGQVIIHPNPQIVSEGASLQDATGELPEALTEENFTTYDMAGQTVIGSVTPITPVFWYVVVEQPTVEALSPFLAQTLFSILLLLAVGGLVHSAVFVTRDQIVQPLEVMRERVEALREGDLTQRIDIATEGELAALSEAFNALAKQLQETIGTLEQRVAERTRGLATAAEVSHATTSILDLNQLIPLVVDLVRERFDLYYVGLFLVDDMQQYAELRAGTGEAGEKMMTQHHRLEIGGGSMVGQCISQAEALIALDVGEEAIRFDNPLLPETRSEMALPLYSRGRVIGAVSVQSTHEAAFDETDIAVMQTMADQVAVAIDNASLFASTQAALEEMEATHLRYLGQAWGGFARRRPVSGYYAPSETSTTALMDEVLPETRRAMQEPRLVVTEAGTESEGAALVAPITLRGQPIGALGYRNVSVEWSEEDVALVQALSEQFALAAENLRLIEATQRRAARERLTREITDKMRGSTSVDRIAQIAIDELYKALGTSRAFVHMGVSAQSDDADGGTPPPPSDRGEP
ncbi:MAG: GAF domain-containing protein [Anaerolineae bacterium]|nr:GAF domain-containing protein [Anaerolineae bacterium]